MFFNITYNNKSNRINTLKITSKTQKTKEKDKLLNIKKLLAIWKIKITAIMPLTHCLVNQKKKYENNVKFITNKII